MNPFPELYLPDDFTQTAEVMRDNVTPPTGAVKVTSDFEKLMSGKTVGKRANFVIEGAKANVQATAFVDIFTLQGKTEDAMPLCITLAPPQAIPGGFGLNADISNVSGEQDTVSIPAGYVWPKMTAILEWGIGGTDSLAEIDFMDGAKINIQACYVRLRAKAESVVAVTGGILVVRAFVGPAQGQSLPAQRTLQNEQVAAGIGQVSAVQPIPRFAKYYRYQQGGSQASVFDVVLFRDSAGASEISRQRWNANALAGNMQPVLIPNGAYYWRIRNQDGAIVVDPGQFVFDLSL